MDDFSNLLLKQIVERIPAFKNRQDVSSEFLTLDLPVKNNAKFGGLVIQTTVDKDIWIRSYPGYSAYCVDSIDELVKIVEGVLKDEILWVIAFKEEDWLETTLIKCNYEIEKENGVTYYIYSWSGTLDNIILAD